MLKAKARTAELIVQTLDEEVLVYDERRATAHCLNRTAGLVWGWSDGKTSVAQMARRLRRTLPLGGKAQALVLEALRCLKRAHLLERPSIPSGSRREALRRLGRLGGAAALLPVVTTIVAPTAAEAASCLSLGQPCTSSPQCCLNNQNIRCCRNGRCAQGQGNCT